MSTLGSILKDNWEWRSQIVRLAFFELKKQSRGAALGWVWFFVQPIIYLFCFWFAIDIGLRGSKGIEAGDVPFILWLAAGIIPWFFIKDMLSGGINVMRKYSYLVKKVKFPLCAISSIYELAMFFLQLMTQVILVVIYIACGQGPDLHLLQVPFLLLLMYAFWYFFSVLMSPICAMSKDVKNMMNSLSTPFFWLSGVLFDVGAMGIGWIQAILYFNPITFFVTAFRDAVYYKVWIWEDPFLVGSFAIVFLATMICALLVYKRTKEKVADVL